MAMCQDFMFPVGGGT